MSAIYQQYRAGGLEVLLAAINPNPQVPEFIRAFRIPFPVGTADEFRARDFMAVSSVQRAFVPWLSFIDRQGRIREQHFGGTPFFQDEDRNVRQVVEKLLAERASSPPQKTKKPR
jgi:hypothetical protein